MNLTADIGQQIMMRKQSVRFRTYKTDSDTLFGAMEATIIDRNGRPSALSVWRAGNELAAVQRGRTILADANDNELMELLEELSKLGKYEQRLVLRMQGKPIDSCARQAT